MASIGTERIGIYVGRNLRLEGAAIQVAWPTASETGVNSICSGRAPSTSLPCSTDRRGRGMPATI